MPSVRSFKTLMGNRKVPVAEQFIFVLEVYLLFHHLLFSANQIISGWIFQFKEGYFMLYERYFRI
ncbi:hypothetical protein IW22_08645 [Chryseobacterium sp. JM1]|nr:hypothetical protein IW22_08645 [Chryseobacterium sp. JM1]